MKQSLKIAISCLFGLIILNFLWFNGGIRKKDSVQVENLFTNEIEKNGLHFADEWEHTGGLLVNTREYQLKLNSEDWKDRYKTLDDFIRKISSLSEGLILLDKHYSQENVREQIYIDKTDRCGRTESIRIRNYVSGYQKGTSTIDLKYVSQNSKENILSKNITVKDEFKETSIFKLEQDVHPCKSNKWSKELRITDIPFQPIFQYCYQIKNIFPFLWNYSETLDLEVKMRNPEYWWQFSQHGRLYDGSKWKSAFTLKYNSINDAINSYVEPLPR